MESVMLIRIIGHPRLEAHRSTGLWIRFVLFKALAPAPLQTRPSRRLFSTGVTKLKGAAFR